MPATKRPTGLTVRSYQVGFGDCFLLSFAYGADPKDARHVLIDFGTTSLPKTAPEDQMIRVANNIAERTKASKLHAIVATHRHADHISGFATRAGGNGPGDIIRKLEPGLVVQPWTEQPDLAKDATAPTALRSARGLHALGLQNMQAFAQTAVDALAAVPRQRWTAAHKQIDFIGRDNLANLSAVENLMAIGGRGKTDYVFAGKRTRLERFLPGVKVHVLGPPSLAQTKGIKKQRSRHKDEFWELLARGLHAANGDAAATRNGATSGTQLFPKAQRFARRGFPPEALWLVEHARTLRTDQLLQLVRILDKAMNNTSVILLFEVGGRKLLFPGDAQWENWNFALNESPRHQAYRALLSDVSLYKVGHHGSLNATPKSLWNLFERKRSRKPAGGAITSIMSTMAGKHGKEASDTEVPRRPLVAELRKEGTLWDTQMLKPGKDFHDIPVF